MSQLLPPTAQHVQDFLRSRGSFAEVQLLPDTTATAQDAATALNVLVSQIGKSIVFGSSVCVAVLCGNQRVDTKALSKLVHSDVNLLKAGEVKDATGYVIGGVSPFGLPPGINVIIDSGLLNHPFCYVAAGHPKAVVRTSGEELIALTGATVERIALEFGFTS
jgi:prolyl-tRNA editing enzyme YbaK/EbsC (Cys-tRNA(Pro) deacylase)